MPEEQKPPEIPAALAELAKMLPPELVDQLTEAAKQASGLGGLTVTRSDAYKAIYANAYRTRIGTGDVTIVFNKAAHTPSILAASNIIEEQTEIILAWSMAKMLAITLTSIVDAFEQEVGVIPIPTLFQYNVEGQRQVVRSLGLPSIAEAPGKNEQAIPVPDAPAEQSTKRVRISRKRPASN